MLDERLNEQSYIDDTVGEAETRLQSDLNIDSPKVDQQKKLGPVETAFVVFKGFVCTGILYMPLNFVNGGWLWSGSMIVMSMFWNLMCFKMLFQVHDAVGGG
jgi:hypothetical protein